MDTSKQPQVVRITTTYTGGAIDLQTDIQASPRTVHEAAVHMVKKMSRVITGDNNNHTNGKVTAKECEVYICADILQIDPAQLMQLVNKGSSSKLKKLLKSKKK